MLIFLKTVPSASNTTSSSRGIDVKPKVLDLLATVLGKSEVEVENKITARDVQSPTTSVRPPNVEVEQLLQNPSTVIEIEDSKDN